MKRSPAFIAIFSIAAAAFTGRAIAAPEAVPMKPAAIAAQEPTVMDKVTVPATRARQVEDAYTITSTLQILKPVDPSVMSDDFQDVRVISQDADSATVEVTYYPLLRQEIGENPRWRQEDAAMIEYLRPTPAENWDEPMRRDLFAELRVAGIDPERLTDRQLVEQVSRWAMRRAHSTTAFAIWTVYYPDGKPAVFPALRDAFEKEKRGTTKTDQQMLDEEALGRAMFYNKVHGSCTSSSIYLSTIFRALGIPTRVVFCIPPFDPNDARQAEMFYSAVHQNRVRETVRAALDGLNGFDNHLFNEVYVGHKWVRLNYSNLGQPILDAHYFGLLTHIFTAADMSQVPLAETWGMRMFKYPAGQPKLSSVNPYRLISVSDHFGANAHLDNPEVPAAELRTVTIVGLLRPGAPEIPSWVTTGSAGEKSSGDFLMSAKEWVAGTYLQMRAFQRRAGHEFLLTADGHPELHARLSGATVSKGDGSFQGYWLKVDDADRSKLAADIAYQIKPVNISETYRWQVAPDLAAMRKN